MRWVLLLLSLASGVVVRTGAVAATYAAEVPAASANKDNGWTPSEPFQRMMTELAREHIPAQYERSKNWGHTAPVLRGWHVSRDGVKVRTKRKWKEVNDGAWQRYKIVLVDPELVDQEQHLEVRLQNVKASPGKVEFDLSAVAFLDVEGRHSQWERGVQLFSISAEAKAKVALKAHVEVEVRLDAAQLPPSLALRPRVMSAELNLLEFRLERVSDLHGPLVKSLSSTAQKILEDKLEDNRQKLVDKMNASLEKRHDKLRFSAGEALEVWMQK